MNSKWQQFQTRHSPKTMSIDNVNTASSNILLDWVRGIGSGDISINGRPAKDFQGKYFSQNENGGITFLGSEHESQMQSLHNFIADVVLAKLDEGKKDIAMAYLMKSFHQGGLMFPTTIPLINVLEPQGMIPQAARDRSINIQVEKDGFRLQETSHYSKVIFTPVGDANKKRELEESCPHTEDDYNGIWVTAKEGEFLFEATSTIHVDFSAGEEQPSLTVTDAAISYNNPVLKGLLDTRALGERIVDFFKNILNLNKVKDLSQEKPQTSSVDEVQNDAKPEAPSP